MTSRILVVDDEQNIGRMLQAILEEQSYEVQTVTGGADAAVACEEMEPDVVLLDLVMPPGPDGLETLETLKARCPDLVVIMMSGKATLHDAVRATKLGAFQFLEKPLTPEGVLVAVRAGLDLCKARAENRALRAALDEKFKIVGSSRAIDEVRSQIEHVASTPARVLITGESGTGKELVARAIHQQSPRVSRPLVCVNCAAIPKDLIESEMFGHERGAFTGASERRLGRFELADGGTLFLDEVGELDPANQAKLLRVLETGFIERVGGERGRSVDVRVVAATNKNLEAEAKEGAFRTDLYYRLNVFPIHVPPLRDRLDDIPELIVYLSGESQLRCGRAAVTFSSAAIGRLMAHSWPGNVRELANLIERLTIVGSEEEVSEKTVCMLLGGREGDVKAQSAEVSGAGSLSEELEAHESRLIQRALAEAGGNVADAARRLSTDRANLYRRMRRLGLNPKDTTVSK